MTNLFPLPYWAPALKRVPTPLQILDEAYASGDGSCSKCASRLDRADAWPRASLQFLLRLSPRGEGVGRTQSG